MLDISVASTGRPLLRLCVGPGDLQLVSEGGGRVSIEGGITVTPIEIDAAHPPDPSVVAALISRFTTGPVRVDAHHATLTIDFGGRTLSVAPNMNSEAWSVNACDGAFVVCLPGGQLASWPPAESPASPQGVRSRLVSGSCLRHRRRTVAGPTPDGDRAGARAGSRSGTRGRRC